MVSGPDLGVVYPFSTPKSYAADNIDDYHEQMRQVAHRDLANFISIVDITEVQRSRQKRTIEHGNEAKVLKDFIRVTDAELVVIVSHPQGFLSNAIFGNHARHVISSFFVRRSRRQEPGLMTG
ncbi:MAG TPA: universal stress protein [Spirochaetota bacterium]|nr:universal stress protein [Spirochaetota bacterium]HPC40746.1 universal stress protein [Spirochaetota bacterium]HPL16700.1 universal stress protein [Spirochaetota bacterium]HQF09345.1 universal stress protein [Spirochaetota bacterium]HQH98041.1 universal stress protein [Spirochaetota bacterium]